MSGKMSRDKGARGERELFGLLHCLACTGLAHLDLDDAATFMREAFTS